MLPEDDDAVSGYCEQLRMGKNHEKREDEPEHIEGVISSGKISWSEECQHV